MAKAIRFTKPEREWLKMMLTQWLEIGSWGGKAKKAAESIVVKLAQSEAPQEKLRDYLTVKDAIEAFRSVLDRRLIVPPNGAGLLFIQMQHKLKALALTREQCVQAATQAGSEWKGNIKAQSILNQAEALLQNYTDPSTTISVPSDSLMDEL